jgi:hypothetical protein
MINELLLVTNLHTDCIAEGYRRKSNRFRCNYCNHSTHVVTSMVGHIKDDHPEHLSISTYEFISHVYICYIHLEYILTNCKFLPIS